VASEAWNLAAAMGCLIGAVLCTAALAISDRTFVNNVATLGTAIGALGLRRVGRGGGHRITET
jgi:hypothetical protein